MNAENEFEKWWEEYAPEFGFPCTGDGLKQWCQDGFLAAYALGRKSGIDAVDSLPHRAMFDAGVEQGIKEGRIIGFTEGRKSGMEEAAEIASTTLEAVGMRCPNVYGVNTSAAILQHIEETP